MPQSQSNVHTCRASIHTYPQKKKEYTCRVVEYCRTSVENINHLRAQVMCRL